MRHAKRDVLSTQDIEDALRLRNVEVMPDSQHVTLVRPRAYKCTHGVFEIRRHATVVIC